MSAAESNALRQLIRISPGCRLSRRSHPVSGGAPHIDDRRFRRRMIDSTYRWAVVFVLAAMLSCGFLVSAYRSGFAPRMSLHSLGVGALLVFGAVLVGRLMGEDFWQALLLRARFGVPFEDDGIHGYGWGLVFGYSLMLAGAVTWVLGNLGVRGHLLRKHP